MARTPLSPRCYTVADLLDLLQMPERTFSGLKKTGRLPFVQELVPRLGKRARFQADLVDRYLAGQWGQSQSFGKGRR